MRIFCSTKKNNGYTRWRSGHSRFWKSICSTANWSGRARSTARTRWRLTAGLRTTFRSRHKKSRKRTKCENRYVQTTQMPNMSEYLFYIIIKLLLRSDRFSHYHGTAESEYHDDLGKKHMRRRPCLPTFRSRTRRTPPYPTPPPHQTTTIIAVPAPRPHCLSQWR